ncbi:MAG TPA: hypothetical protein VEV84_15115 [Pyrinomonadaceae bacterium]|nr:hypothetical protein [Pyrinomonadaceae bacterium]
MTKKASALLLIVLFCLSTASAQLGNLINKNSKNPTTLAVYGDWPYSTELLNDAPLLLNSINNDDKVRLVLHVGDIHSGSMKCTGAGFPLGTYPSDPTWNLGIYNIFQQFYDPVVYTPGDNEWIDCHKKKEGDGVVGSGAPLNELAAVRSLFFANPGYTLGGQTKRVVTQAEAFDPNFPTDAQFVENVIWEDSQVVFVTLNLPGSNNDGVKWTAPFTNETARQQEVAERTAADMRWLQKAFDLAEHDGARGVLIGIQADMWDPAQIAAGGDGLNGYDAIVQELADLSIGFGRPVLLINGDSHVYEADQPLADPSSATGVIHGTQAVSNLTRITVEGSTAANEWLKLTVDPRTAGIFSWERIQYLP